MDNYKLISLAETCRTCTEQIHPNTFKNIFEIDLETELAPINFIKKIKNDNFEVKENDGLPQQICESCFNNFSVIYEFSLICEESQLKLQEEFLHINKPEIICKIEEFKVEILNDSDEEENSCTSIKHKLENHDNYKTESLKNHDDYKTEFVITNIDDDDEGDDDDGDGDDDDIEEIDIDKDPDYVNYEQLFELKDDQHFKEHEQIDDGNNLDNIKENERILRLHKFKVANRKFDEDDESDRWSSDNDIDKVLKELDNFTCEYCKRNFNSYSALNIHQKPRNCKNFPKYSYYLCHTCGVVLRPSAIEAHNNQHKGIKPYRCTICGVGYTRGANYTMHMRVQHKDIKSNCKYCDQKFKSFYLLEMHKSAKHPNEKQIESTQVPTESPKAINHQSTRYKCPFCPKQFRCLSLLSMHCKQHSKPDNCKHSCQLCGAVFKRADHLKLHTMAVHEKNKPHFCDHCPRRFAMAADRNSHMIAAHTGKRYVCKYCNKEFCGRNSLQQHERKHEGIKRFQCGFCDDKFLTTSSLQSHERLNHAVNDDMKKQMAIKIYKELVPIKENKTEITVNDKIVNMN